MARIHSLIILVAIVFLSCKDNRQMIDKNIDSISTLQCRAAVLNDQRFDLFEQIRVLESDTINNKIAIDSLKNVASIVKAKSLACADSLRIQISDIITSQKFSDEDRKYFDDKINTLVEKCKSSK